ncbi:hypothetical protein Ptr902_11818 [Pyrenophora tritici-repentis]|uniref:Amelogenin domain containing protein n=1 Tax=Pyrenophora tritici-repentis TaxID=45151 RepID=A0A317ALD9_9PLEO|nr:hypothetical protein A1F99_043200 [Pyrenophora tritici-repentis]KAF7574322.1 Amelogenin domain containing protein [Pyrenophora tritici-repentis]KAI2476834.1 hypothetical protein Ptr902_11818 [Pyrenophora tritici-repentis]
MLMSTILNHLLLLSALKSTPTRQHLPSPKAPILHAPESTLLALSLAATKALGIPLLSSLNTLPLALAAKDAEELGVQMLVLVVALGPAAVALVRQLE